MLTHWRYCSLAPHHRYDDFLFSESIMVAVPDGNEGDEAELISPEIILEGETDLCLSFVYLMAGTGSGTLSVSLRHANGTTRALWLSFDEQSTEVFMMTSSNGNIFRVTDPLFGEFTPVICGCDCECLSFKRHSVISWTFPMELSWYENNRTTQMVSQHWF